MTRFRALAGVAPAVAVLVAPAIASLRGGAALPGNVAAGRRLYHTGAGPYLCGNCHTLKTAGSFSYVGPNLDTVKPAYATIIKFVTSGHVRTARYPTGMPGFSPSWSTKQIEDVAAFVYTSTHH